MGKISDPQETNEVMEMSVDVEPTSINPKVETIDSLPLDNSNISMQTDPIV
jgi:hypothetical protein